MNEFNNNQNFENQENQPQSNIYRPEPIILDQPPINVVHSTTENDIDAVFSNGNPSPFMPSPKPPRRFSFLTVIISVALAFTVSVIGSFLVFSFLNKNQNDNTNQNNYYSGEINQGGSGNTTTINVEENASNMVEAVTMKAGPSVVGIATTASSGSIFGSGKDTAEGSGIIYTTDGYIITNYHVISAAVNSKKSSISVFLSQDPNTALPANIVGYNIASDLAVLKINKTGLPAIELGNSDELKVGQYAIAIGSPGGMEFMNSVSYGIISGLNRSLSTGTGTTMTLIQTDAAINPGNSGGALLNSKGQLIGINSAKLVNTSFEGMGFAIPVNSAKEICDKIINKQNDPTPYLGIEINTQYTPEILQRLGYPKGAVIDSVVSGSPADESGLQRGDIVTEFNGVTISSYTELENAIANCTPGKSVKIKIYRGGRSYTTTLQVASNNS